MTTAVESEPQAGAVRRVDQLLAHYGTSHRNPRNEAIHMVAIPLIVFSLLGMLYAAHPYVAYAVVAASLVYYARLSMVFFASMAVLSLVMLAGAHALGALAFQVSLAIFVGAWIAQFIGHKIEGKKPSFFEDLQYLLVGPLFVLAIIFRKLGIHW